METAVGITLVAGLLSAGVMAYLFWRYYWFFRNPPRVIPPGESLVSPADGTVVYVQEVHPRHPVISIKKGLAACVNDIVRRDLEAPRILIGVFMSPFNVHYNRSPLAGQVEFVHHYPARPANLAMAAMHLRTLLNRPPHYHNSRHIISNERTVTKIASRYRQQDLSCYIVQIAGRSVNGIDSYVTVGQQVKKGDILGMIRIGSQVDLVVTRREGMRVLVKPGDKVRAGETVVIA